MQNSTSTPCSKYTTRLKTLQELARFCRVLQDSAIHGYARFCKNLYDSQWLWNNFCFWNTTLDELLFCMILKDFVTFSEILKVFSLFLPWWLYFARFQKMLQNSVPKNQGIMKISKFIPLHYVWSKEKLWKI